MNLTEKANCGKLKPGVFNRRGPRYGAKPFMGVGKADSFTKKDSTPSSKINWGKSRQSISSSGVHSETSISKEDSRIVLALSEGRGEARCEVGIAVINVSQPHLILCQISDTQSYDNTLRKINIFNPSQILVPMTFVESANQSRLIEKVKEHFSQVTYTPVRRNTYNKISGMEFIQEYCVSSLNSVLLVLQYRHYALTAASALFRFLQNNLNIFYASGSIKIDYQESEGYAVIDVSTADRLELVSSTKPNQASKYSTLFGVLNNCYTRIGERALRTVLLQPPFVTTIILERQECVTALIKHPEKLQSIQVMLQKLGNVDQLLTLPTIVVDDSQTCSNRQLNYILYLNGLVPLIITLSDVISSFDQTLFKNISVTLQNPDFLNIRDMVRTLIHENAYAAKSHNGLLQRCFAIKPGINGLLDLVRKIYSERLDDMREYVKTLGEKYDLPLTLGNNITKGYHIVFSLNKHQRITMKKSDIPKEFIQVCRLAGSFTMKTMELINFQTRIDDIIADILKISNVMIFKTLTSFKKYMGLFYRLCEDIAIIDVLQSLAEVSIRNNYVKPTFSDFTEVKESQHPMLDMLAHEKPVPNLIFSSRNHNVHIITGPNGSGKSIYIRQLMLLQIMAQIGGYVSASSAIFRPADRMFARVYLEDNMECGASSFVLEMKEIVYILSHITDSSLIIIDELARSTSLEEGAALAMAICECFVKSSAFVYLTSHFTLVTKLSDLYLNVKNWFMDTEASGDTPKSLKLNFKHTIKPGVTSLTRYGIFMVKNIWPVDLLEDVYSLLEHNTKTQKEIKTQQLSKEATLKYNLDADLQMLRSKGKLNPSKINELVNHYQVDIENIDLNRQDYYTGGIPELVRESVAHFDDSVPDDVLSEAVDEVEYSLISPNQNSNNSSYKRLSYFIGENSENIHLLNPEVQIVEPSINSAEPGIPSSCNFNQRANPNIKIFSNILLNENNEHLNMYQYNNNQLECHPNLGGFSQETYQNSQDLEEINEINRSLLTEMHIAKENFEGRNSEILHEDSVTENCNAPKHFGFMDEQERKTNAEITPYENNSFSSFVNEQSQVSDFCFLKPSKPPIRKRFNFKNLSPMAGKPANLDETDQLTFSLGLFQNQDKTSTPIICRKSYSSQEDEKIDCTLDEMIDTANIENSRCLFSQEDSQPWPCGTPSNEIHHSNVMSQESEQKNYIDSINEENNSSKYSLYTQKYGEQERSKVEDSWQRAYSNCSVDEGIHIFPKINIVQGPNNKSLSFGEEDQPFEKTKANKVNKNTEDNNISSKTETIDKKFEQFVIEETKMFLSNSVDIFDGDVDDLEITIQNNERSRISHEEVSENVISILKSEANRTGKLENWCVENEDIVIQDTQPEAADEIDDNKRHNSSESENESFTDSIENSISEKNTTKDKAIFEEKKVAQSYDLICDNHKSLEKSELNNYSNNRLLKSLKKNGSEPVNIPSNSDKQKLQMPTAETNTTNISIETSIHPENNEHNLIETNNLETSEYTGEMSRDSIGTSPSNPTRNTNMENSSSGKKNKTTISTSLSEASRKRNLDTSFPTSTPPNDERFEVSNKKIKLQSSSKDNTVNISSKSSKSTDEIKELTPNSYINENKNDSDTSSSRDKITTSISDASRRRNLDNPNTTSTSSLEEGKKTNSSSLSGKLNQLVTPKKHENHDAIFIKNSMLQLSGIRQENSEDNYADCRDNRAVKDSDSSHVCYETAAETDPFSQMFPNYEPEFDDFQGKQYEEENIMESQTDKCMNTSTCTTQTFPDSASMHFETADGSSSSSTLKKADKKSKDNEKITGVEKKVDSNGFGNCSVSSNSDSLNDNASKLLPKKKKYLGYRRRPIKESIIKSSKNGRNEENKKCKSQFKPFKLTKYQIQEEFDKQDQLILGENVDVETYNKYLKQRMNRPSIKQIQNAEHIATFRRTQNGTILLPPHRKTHKPRKSMPTKVFEGSKLIDVSIFSDQNASKMTAFLASKERNYNQFKFEQNIQAMVAVGEESHSFNFCSQFVQKKDKIKFSRSKSFGEFNFQKYTDVYHNNSFKFEADVTLKMQHSQSSSIFLPDGYLKENKKDIDLICSKYLNDSNCGFYRSRTSPLS